MPKANITDVDLLRNSPALPGRVEYSVEKESEILPRHRMALTRGDRSRPFIDRYFMPPDPMPWAGVMRFRDVHIVENGRIYDPETSELYVGDSLMDPKSSFSSADRPASSTEESSNAYEHRLPSDSVALEGITASIVCAGRQTHGRWIVDVMPRLDRILQSGLAIDTYLFAGPDEEWQIDALEQIGVDLEKCRFIDLTNYSVRCEHVYVPTYDRFKSEIRPEFLRVHTALRARVVGEPGLSATRDLFVSRPSDGRSRPLRNRAEVEALAVEAGYEIVKPETLPLAERIRLFASARRVVGECGSGLYHTVYSNSGIKIGVIQGNDNLNFLQSQIGKFAGQDVFYVLGSASSGELGGFSVDLQDVRYLLEAMKG